MTKYSHNIIAGVSAVGLGLPILPALISANLPDIDVKFKKNKGLLGHRGITHHAVILGILIVLFVWFFSQRQVWYNSVIASFLVGYISHLFADSLTYSGIPYWKHKNRFSLSLFKTGSVSEFVFVAVFMVVVIVGSVMSKGLQAFYEIRVVDLALKVFLSHFA